MNQMALAIAGALHLAAPACHAPCQAALIANAEFEAGPALNPCATSRSGVGLWQLAGEHRRRFLARHGAHWCSIPAQVEYVVQALTEMGIAPRLFAERDPGRAASIVMIEFERPRNRDPSRRMRRAAELYRELLGSTALATP